MMDKVNLPHDPNDPLVDHHLIDPSRKQYWNTAETLMWVMYRDINRVRDLFGLDVDHGELMATALHPIDQEKQRWLDSLNPEEREMEAHAIERDAKTHFRRACSEIRQKAAIGELTATGRRNGRGPREVIPIIEWPDLLFDEPDYPQIGLVTKECGGSPFWTDVNFEPQRLMAIWPAAIKAVDGRDRQEDQELSIEASVSAEDSETGEGHDRCAGPAESEMSIGDAAQSEPPAEPGGRPTLEDVVTWYRSFWKPDCEAKGIIPRRDGSQSQEPVVNDLAAARVYFGVRVGRDLVRKARKQIAPEWTGGGRRLTEN